MKGIIGKKVGMTQVYDEKGVLIPVTVIQAGPCVVLDVKTKERDGYASVQYGFGSRKAKNVSKAVKGSVEKAGLKDNPDYTWVDYSLAKDDNGKTALNAEGKPVYGVRITRLSTGASLFLPYSGFFDGTDYYDGNAVGYCWSSSLDTSDPFQAFYLHIFSTPSCSHSFERCRGLPIRPVWEE